MSTEGSAVPEEVARRPLVIDVVRAFEGILLGLVLVILAAVLAGGTFNAIDFAAVVVIPGMLMVFFMHLGAPPRRLFIVRALGAIVGWGLIWVVFVPVYFLLYYALFRSVGPTTGFALLAIVDGVILALSILGVDRLARRLHRTTPTPR